MGYGNNVLSPGSWNVWERFTGVKHCALSTNGQNKKKDGTEYKTA